MKKQVLIPILLIGISINVLAQDVPQIPSAGSIDSLKTTVKKLINYYDSYENGSPESLKKAKYNDAVDEMSGGTATQKDKNDAYKIIDAYIKADTKKSTDTGGDSNDTDADSDQDSGIDLGINQQEMEDMANDAQQQAEQGQQFAEEAVNNLMNMSYAEYESYILVMNPLLCRKDIQKSYNQMHQNDGKHVSVDPNCEESKMQKQMKAIDILNHPKEHTYSQYRSAILFLSPNTSESEIRAAWNKSK